MAPYCNSTFSTRCVKDWLDRVHSGRLALPVFQRSYVWKKQTIASYLKAVFENRPTGTFLVFPTKDASQFDSRTVHGDGSTGSVNEYLLDGQQRIRSLWSALWKDTPPFYLKVADVRAPKLELEGIVFVGQGDKHAKARHRRGCNLGH